MDIKKIDGNLVNNRLVYNPKQSLHKDLTFKKLYLQKKSIIDNKYDVNDFLFGNFFEGKLPDSLEKALKFASKRGIILTCPELIAAKVKADKTHKYWQNWVSVHTEENIGLDKKGIAQLITVHGGGLLTPKRIRKAYKDGLINGSAAYTNEEFYNLLEGRVPSGKIIPMFNYEDIKAGIDNLPHRFGIITPYDLVKNLYNGWHKKDKFINNPLNITRLADINLIEPFYEKAKKYEQEVGSYHSFKYRDPSQPQGRSLFVNYDYTALLGNIPLNFIGKYVVVFPKNRKYNF